MITLDDIEAFAPDYEKADAACSEFVRRSRKRFPNGEPLPHDRWIDGALGHEQLALSVEALRKFIAMQNACLLQMQAELLAHYRMVDEGMGLGPVPDKYRQE